jgi:hypothetical protein
MRVEDFLLFTEKAKAAKLQGLPTVSRGVGVGARM